VFGLDALVDDARFATNDDRVAHRDELIACIEAATSARSAQAWIDALTAAGIPSGPIWDFAHVFTDPHLTARNFFVDAPHPTLGPVRQIGSPLRLSETPPRIAHAGPLLGGDSFAVLRELGFAEDELTRLADAGVTVQA
jgi:formyl-CoA transferase